MARPKTPTPPPPPLSAEFTRTLASVSTLLFQVSTMPTNYFDMDTPEQRACDAALDQLAEQHAREEAERKRLWGDRYPPYLGAKPPEHPVFDPPPAAAPAVPVKAKGRTKGKSKTP